MMSLPLPVPVGLQLPEAPGISAWRALGRIMSTTIPGLERDPTDALLRPAPDAGYHVRPWPVALGEVSVPGWLFVPDQATGRAVVLAHGTTCSSPVPYLHFIRGLLKAGIAVYAFELDGHGQNPRTLCAEGLCENLPAAIKSLGRSDAVDSRRIGVLGVSLGGACALEAAARSKRIKAVATIAAPYRVSIDDWGKLLELLGLFNWELWPTFGEATPNRLLAFLSNRMRVLDPEGAEVELDFMDERTIGAVHHLLASLDPLGAAARLKQTPLLVLNGEWDQIVPAWQAEDLFARASGPKALHILPRRNHLSIILSREAVKRTVGWFEEWL